MEKTRIIEEKQNPLFKRKEVKVIIESLSSPTLKDSEETISKNFSAKEGSVKIKGIHGKFGRNTFLISANIYSSKEDKDNTEPKQKEKKSKAGGAN